MTNNDKIQFVLQALNEIRESCKDQPGIKHGIIDNISTLIVQVQKSRRFYEHKTIGFFGAQKRGKSSLINQLLGCDLMPTGPIPMSSVAIEIKQDSSIAEGMYEINVIHANGIKDLSQTVDFELAKILLREYGSHKGTLFGMVDTIRVSAAFPDSVVLKNGGILVDTPGAEVAFEQDGKADAANIDDVTRAINILGKTHIVVFVERADQLESKNSQQFYDAHLRPLHPLGVLNWKDEFGKEDPKYEKVDSPMRDQAKIRDMQASMLRTYGFNLDRLICVSCKEASEAKKNNNPDILKSSNLPLLETRILEEIQKLNPEMELEVCFRELKDILQLIDDKDIARTIFRNAQRPFYVFIRNETNESLKRMAKEIYEQFQSN